MKYTCYLEYIMADFKTPATPEIVQKTIDALSANGMTAEYVQTSEEAKAKVLNLIPKGAEVMTMTSVTLQSIGVTETINNSGGYNSVKNELNKLNRETDSLKMQKLGSAPEYTVGSVHAVTQDGKVIVASNTGSQMAAYVYGSPHVIWVIGTQKIVENVDEGIKRIYEYILPQESVRLNAQYNINTGSFVSKLLIFNREFNPSRIHIIFVNETLGF